MAYENFNAASAVFHIKGVNVHPGEAKDIMVNAALVGCEIVSRLPEAETPAHTSGREGFYHLTDMSGDVASATLSFIIRDHDKTTFEKRLQNLRDVAQSMNQKYRWKPSRSTSNIRMRICSLSLRIKWRSWIWQNRQLPPKV